MKVLKRKSRKITKRQRDQRELIEIEAERRRSLMRLLDDQQCVECGETFTPIKKWQKFDKAQCKMLNWNRNNTQTIQAVT